MISFLTFMHALISVILVIIILMQSGRGGGLTEAFASAESMFGAKTNAFMIKATTVFAVIFLATSLSLAFLSSQKEKSLMSTQLRTQAQLPSVELPGDEDNFLPEEVEEASEALKEEIPGVN